MSVKDTKNDLMQNGIEDTNPQSDLNRPTGSGPARALANFIESILPVGKTSTADAGLDNGSNAVKPDESAELADLLLEGPDALVIIDREAGIIIEANHRFADWVCEKREAINGRKFADFISTTDLKAARCLYEDAGAGGVHVLELLTNDPAGRTRLVEFTAAKAKAGAGAFAVIAGRDLGERAATERYLRAERDRLNMFIRSMRDALVLLSPSGDILFANPTAEQMFEPFELPVICHRWLAEFTQRDKPDLQGLASAYEGQTMELEATDGRVFLVTRSFLFESGRKTMVMLMIKDISEQRIIERQNHQLEIELVRESKLSEFGMLSAGIAHNLNGPLMGILGFCDILEMRNNSSQEIQQIRQQATVMREIIANLMHKSRSERESQPQYLVIEDMIRTELRFLDADLFFKHEVRKVLDLDPCSPPIHGVYIDFSQVIGNLLRNAIDAMHSVDEKVLTVRTRWDGRHLTLMISDTGCGMTDHVKQNIFRPFFTTKPKRQDAAPGEPTGTGLGMATTRKTLARYGAEISFESANGSGTTFTVSIPLDRKPIA
jgi:PAS domain S-box-containing protein